MQADDFSTFYRDIHGWEPFPWQRQLVHSILEHGTWPSLVDVPTGLGKTSMLDIAVFLSTLDCDRHGSDKIGRRRIYFVVDRRIVVDQAAHHAHEIEAALAEAVPGTVAAQVADRLRNMAGPTARDGLLPTVTMRGGVTWDAAWLSRPDQPGIVTGTVDQIGSRLLFRGYGVSQRRWPIDAALVGMDALVIGDEAHLAAALTTTLASVAAHDTSSASLGVPPATVVQLTATGRDPGVGWTPPFDEATHLDVPEAAQRLNAPKRLRLITTPKATAAKEMAAVAADQAATPGARVLVVCNTIDRARDVHTLLGKAFPESVHLDLLIGRSRSVDREAVVDRVIDLYRPDRQASPEAAVLVATQTVEVGIDLDATAMVTENASWDALVQRFGRVNRRGLHRESPVVVVHDDDPKPPVYGETRLRTADFIEQQLQQAEELDVSPLALRRLSPPSDTMLPPPATPVLLPAHIDAWARTSPAPSNDAPLDPYLHGFDNGVAPVAIAWRDGLLEADGSSITRDQANQYLSVVPIQAEECVEAPLSAVRQWLTDAKPTPVSDWDEDEDWDIPFGEDSNRAVWRRAELPDGRTQWQLAGPAEIRPGDLVVAPIEGGGLDAYGWAPKDNKPVSDISELAALERNLPVLLLDQGLARRLGLPPLPEPAWDAIRTWQTTDEPDVRTDAEQRCRDLVSAWLTAAPLHDEGPWSRNGRRERLATAMAMASLQAAQTSHSEYDGELDPSFSPVVLRPSFTHTPAWRMATDETVDGSVHLGDSGDDGSPSRHRRVTLAQHGQAVADRAAEICEHLGLPDDIARTVTDAARWHDLGKTDPRFQAMLFDGDRMRALLASEPIAKSGMPPGDLVRRRTARVRSELPRGARHEAWSYALVKAQFSGAETDGGDSDLLLHLIASHHGHARPLLPPVPDQAEHDLACDLDGRQWAAPLPKTVDLGHARRFRHLNERYGRWGVALLEAIVRCADMTVSGEGS